MQDRLAIVEIYIIESRVISNPFSAAIHIANSSSRYKSLMNELYKRGDFVKAKIINVKNRIPQLTTVDEEFGVVKSFCSQCGEILNLKDRILVCHVCGNKEHRKVSQDYGKIKIGGSNGGSNIKRK